MRYIVSLLFAPTVWAGLTLTDGNAIGLKNPLGTDQSARPFTTRRYFPRGEMKLIGQTAYPRPYLANTPITDWQADNINRWDDGSVQGADISYKATIAAGQQVLVNFRPDTSPCSGASTVSGCQALGLSMAQALNFDAGSGAGQWGAKMRLTANPQGPTSPIEINARTMLSDGWCYPWLKGPVVTQYVCGKQDANGNMDTARRYAFGWSNKRVLLATSGMSPTDLSFTVDNASAWVGIATPFIIFNPIYTTERMKVCYVDTSVTPHRIYIGDNAGTSPACANINGRGVAPTSAGQHTIGYGDKVWWDEENRYVATNITGSTYDITLSSTTGISSVSTIQVGDEYERICNVVSSTVVRAGVNADGCAANHTNQSFGRGWFGSNIDVGGGSISWPVGTPVYSTPGNWVTAGSDRYKSIQPVFILSFYTGWPGVGIEYTLHNSGHDRLQDQEFDFTALKGPADTVAGTRTALRFVPGSVDKFPDGTSDAMWKNDRKIWDGTAPGEINYDFNLPYLRLAGIVLFDPTLVPDSSLIATITTNNRFVNNAAVFSPALDNGSHGIMQSRATFTTGYHVVSPVEFDGPIWRSLPNPGPRCEVAISPCWYYEALLAMSTNLTGANRWLESLMSVAAIAGHMPVHYIEGDTSTSRKYCNAGTSTAETTPACSGANATLPAFGYPLSRHARPNLNWVSRGANLYADLPNWIGQYTRAGWSISQSDITGHWPSLAFIPYALTGDWIYYQIQLGYASYAALNSGYPALCTVPGTSDPARQGCGGGSWGLGGMANGVRNWAWAHREINQMAFIGRDGSPEKELFTRTANINFAATEGQFNVTDGQHYNPCNPSSPQWNDSFWCAGRYYRGNNDPNWPVVGPSEFTVSPGNRSGGTDYMTYYKMMMLYQAKVLGLKAEGSLRGMAPRIINQVRNPAFPFPWGISCFGQYWGPVVTANPVTIGTRVSFLSWAEAYAERSPGCNDTGFTNLYANDCNMEGGYAWLAGAVTAGIYDVRDPNGWTGASARDWIFGNMRCNANAKNAPQWALTPQADHEVRDFRITSLTSTTATIRFIRPPKATPTSCSYRISTTFPTDSSTAGDTVYSTSVWNQDLSLSLTGLVPSSTHYLRMTCGPARSHFTFTTN